MKRRCSTPVFGGKGHISHPKQVLGMNMGL